MESDPALGTSLHYGGGRSPLRGRDFQKLVVEGRGEDRETARDRSPAPSPSLADAKQDRPQALVPIIRFHGRGVVPQPELELTRPAEPTAGRKKVRLLPYSRGTISVQAVSLPR
jgi:hypothetical protein